MKDRAWVEEKVRGLRQENRQRLADYHATEGAIQMLELLLHEDEQTNGLPLERLFPGANVSTDGTPATSTAFPAPDAV